MKELTLGSLFDGIGGFPLAGSRYGIKALWASEIEPFPIKVTKIRFPDMKHLGDITKINGAEIDPVDIITFGSPCQDLSVAGKRAGLAGERSGLFMEAVRIIKEMRNTYAGTNEPIRPRFAVWENVPGAFSSNKGEDFRAVLEEICRVKDETVIIPGPPKEKWSTVGTIMGNGYSIAWRILDAQYWGVPQRRRRIFLVADFGGQSAPEILFKRQGLSRHSQESGNKRESIASDAGRSVGKTSYCIDHVVTTGGNCTAQGPCYKEEQCFTLKASGAHAVAQTPKTMLIRCGKEGGDKGPLIQDDKSATLSTLNIQTLFAPQNTIYGIDQQGGKGGANYTVNVMPSVLSDSHGTPHAVAYPVDTVVLNDQGGSQMDVSENVVGTLRAEMHGNIPAICHSIETWHCESHQEIASTLKARDWKDPQCINQQYSVRRLTPLECERLQGFPDGWTNIPGQTEATQEELEFWREVWLTWDKTQVEDPEKVKPRSDKAILKWLKNPTSDSAQYKALGNSVAVPCPEYVMEGIAQIESTER